MSKKNSGVLILFSLILMQFFVSNSFAASVRAKIGDKVTTKNGELTITSTGFRHGFGSGENYDPDINSPKSANFSPKGDKIYVNSLEGCKTVVYDAKTLKKLKTIIHDFPSGSGPLWLPQSGFYKFTHYDDGLSRAFKGKPVEATFSRNGKYLFVPYYRRTFDLNAQDPSALAVIDTEKDEIVLMTETGPLPKMVKVSNNGKLLAITHWGDNTVGFLDISDPDPKKWHHLSPVVIGKQLNLNYSLTRAVNRDSGSGYLLRGTVFLPGDSLMLVSGMAGPMAVIDVKKREWIGMIGNFGNVRHITMKGDMLYFSKNSAGEVVSVPVANVVEAISSQRSNSRSFNVSGSKSVKVGSGARTLKASPSGKYLFVACNTSSEVCIVRTDDMTLIGRISADSFPVGLDVSKDGKLLVTTSQGKKGKGGGNAVDFFSIEYSHPEEIPAEEIFVEDSITNPQKDIDISKKAPQGENSSTIIILICVGVALLVALISLYFILRKRKRKD